MTTLLIAEHNNVELTASTLHALTAARQIGQLIHVLVAGFNVEILASRVAMLEGIEKVLIADGQSLESGLAENVEPTIISIASGYSHIVCAATAYGKNIAPRVAAKLAVGQVSDITRVLGGDIFERPIHAGNAIATVQSNDPIKVITVRVSAFAASANYLGKGVSVERIAAAADSGLSTVVSRTLTKLERPDLSTASVVISGGRALGSKEQYRSVLEPLADELGGALGASRAAVDAGYASNDFQVGQTGKIIAPDIYIAVGISGAIQHLAGMKDSKTIVAINKDEEAPIFGVADYGLVADLFSAVPDLVRKLSV